MFVYLKSVKNDVFGLIMDFFLFVGFLVENFVFVFVVLIDVIVVVFWVNFFGGNVVVCGLGVGVLFSFFIFGLWLFLIVFGFLVKFIMVN